MRLTPVIPVEAKVMERLAPLVGGRHGESPIHQKKIRWRWCQVWVRPGSATNPQDFNRGTASLCRGRTTNGRGSSRSILSVGLAGQYLTSDPITPHVDQNQRQHAGEHYGK